MMVFVVCEERESVLNERREKEEAILKLKQNLQLTMYF
jgi:hypothetical protein